MITVEKLSYSFPEKDLYKDVSFTLEDGQHAVLIGSNETSHHMKTADIKFFGQIINV